jgi:hypothetical protein
MEERIQRMCYLKYNFFLSFAQKIVWTSNRFCQKFGLVRLRIPEFPSHVSTYAYIFPGDD